MPFPSLFFVAADGVVLPLSQAADDDSLAYWNEVLMPLAIKAQQIAEREASTKNEGVAKLYELIAGRGLHWSSKGLG